MSATEDFTWHRPVHPRVAVPASLVESPVEGTLRSLLRLHATRRVFAAIVRNFRTTD